MAAGGARLQTRKLSNRRHPPPPRLMSNVECRMSNVECRLSAVGCWAFALPAPSAIGYPAIGNPPLRCWLLDVGCWMSNVECRLSGLRLSGPIGYRLSGYRQSAPSMSAVSPLQIQRTTDPQPRPGHNVRINLRGGYIRMPQQILQGADVHPRFQKVGGEGMPQRCLLYTSPSPRD